MVQISITTGSSVPIFRQIVDQVRLAAARGAVRAGEQLPSVRALAERLVVNPNTVAKAYAELAADGLIETHQGKGVFIAAPRQVYTEAERLHRLEPAIDALIHQAIALNHPAQQLAHAVDRRVDELELRPQTSGDGRPESGAEQGKVRP
jgi:GntR family transcriptional regulator